MKLHDLPTPCLVVDLDVLESNIARWQEAISAQSVRLRPHIKTHKIPELARRQLAAGACGITSAKVSEAQVFVEEGVEDVFIAYPIVGIEKARAAAALARECTLTVEVESEAGARDLSAAAAEAGVELGVLVEVDTGLGRCGAAPPAMLGLCRQVMELPGLKLRGIFTFRGANFAGANGRPVAELAAEEGRLLIGVANELRAAGVPIEVVSAGSTPTGRQVAAVPGITEVRPGTYIFGDYMNAAAGHIKKEEVALSVLCTVVSQPRPGYFTIDGGSKTFSGDVYPPRLNLGGYASCTTLQAFVESMSEEHGVVRLEDGPLPALGERLHFHPIHVCPAVNLSDELYGVRGEDVEAVWPVRARGKRY